MALGGASQGSCFVEHWPGGGGGLQKGILVALNPPRDTQCPRETPGLSIIPLPRQLVSTCDVPALSTLLTARLRAELRSSQSSPDCPFT